MWYPNLIDCMMCVDVWWVPHRVFTGLNWALLTTTRSLNCALRYSADVASAFPWVVTICNREIESTFHILGDCHFSMTLWNRLGILVALIPSFTKPLPKWLHLNGISSYASKIIIRSLCVLFSWFECRWLSGHMDKSCFPIRGA